MTAKIIICDSEYYSTLLDQGMSAQADIGPVVTVNSAALYRMSDAIIREAQIMRDRAAPGPRQDVRAALICFERLRGILFHNFYNQGDL